MFAVGIWIAMISHMQAVEKGVLTYRLPLLNQTLPALPCRLANSTVGELAKDLVNKASVSIMPLSVDSEQLASQLCGVFASNH